MNTIRRVAMYADGVVALAVVLGAGIAGLGYLTGRWVANAVDRAVRLG